MKKTSRILIALLILVALIATVLSLASCGKNGGYAEIPSSKKESTPVATLGGHEVRYELFRAYALPVLCLAYGGMAGLSRYCRGSMLEVVNSDFVRTARAKGVPEGRVIWEHAFRNALVTLITLFGGLLPGLVAGSVLVEYIFNIPGMGTLSLLSLSSRDYPLQMALFFFAGVLTLLGILVSDLLYAVADARIRLNK